MIAIHIGLKKAGSSTLQKFLFRNRNALLAHSIVYPPLGSKAHIHAGLARQIVNFGDPAQTTNLVDELIEFRKYSGHSTMLLSSELFEGAPAEGILFLRYRLKNCRHAEPVKIVLILRDLVDLIASSYAQKIKSGYNTYDFDTFFADRIKERRVNYFETASRWAAAFGWKNMIIRPLDSQHLRNGNLVDDVFHSLGIDFDSHDYTSDGRVAIRNPRPGWRVIEAVRALYSGSHGLPEQHPMLKVLEQNGIRKTLGSVAMQIGFDLKWNDDRGRYLTHLQAQECSNIYRETIDRLNEFLTEKLPPAPPDLKARNFVKRKFIPEARAIPRRELTEFYDRMADRWFCPPASR